MVRVRTVTGRFWYAELWDNRPEYSQHNSATSSVAHTDGMHAEKQEGLHDGALHQAELAQRRILRRNVRILPPIGTSVNIDCSRWIEEIGYHDNSSVGKLSKNALGLHFFRQRITFSLHALLPLKLVPFRSDFRVHLLEAYR
jgi:hypothetical protein